MSLIHTLTILICLAALFSYVNHRLLGGVLIGNQGRSWVLMQIKLFSLVREFSARTISILTWGGLRGGISVALALSLPLGRCGRRWSPSRMRWWSSRSLCRGSRSTGCWDHARASRTGLKTASQTGSSFWDGALRPIRSARWLTTPECRRPVAARPVPIPRVRALCRLGRDGGGHRV